MYKISSMSYDVITIGSATRDVYLESNVPKTISSSKFFTGKAICFPAGSKIGVDNLYFETGGSALNTSITFAKQGLKAGIICKIGYKDFGAKALKDRLREVGVSTKYILKDNKELTAYSIVVHSTSGERTIFVYRGASSNISFKDIDFKFLKDTKWIFITHLGGKSAKIFTPLIEKAVKNKVKIAMNPGVTQLKMGKDFIPFLNNVDLFFVNQEEAALLAGLSFKNEDKIFKKLDNWVGGIVIMTKGPDGVSVSDGKMHWNAPALKEPRFIDRTGAGDAFASGFTSAIIKGKSIEDAIQLGSANATGVVGQWGANKGLLRPKDSSLKFGRLNIKLTNIVH